jgi:hypothetical protein
VRDIDAIVYDLHSAKAKLQSAIVDGRVNLPSVRKRENHVSDRPSDPAGILRECGAHAPCAGPAL